MKTACPNIARKKYKYKMCRPNMTLFKRAQMRLGLLPDWSLAERDTVVLPVKTKKIGTLKSNKQKEGDTDDDDHEISFGTASEVYWSLAERVTVKTKNIGTLKSNKQKEGDTEDETDEKDEAGPPGKADMEDPKGTGNTIMNDTPDVVSRYENKIDDEIIEVMTKTSSLENWKEKSNSQGILPYPLIYIWNCIFNGSTQALDSSDFQSQTPPQDLKKDMESSVSLIGLEIIWVFKGGGIGSWWIGTLL